MSAASDFVEQFVAEVRRVAGSSYRAHSSDEALSVLEAIIGEVRPRSVILGRGDLLESLGFSYWIRDRGITLLTADSAGENWKENAAQADLGITEADWGFSDTGTLVLEARPGQERATSLLPPVHLAVLSASRLLTGISPYLSDLARRPELPSCITWITGPSRTADIELTLTVGVHGPGQLHVILLDFP
ncbi:MAG: lactate utilization protein [Acidobacteria bacterium]|nr:lactate utilization protein [Acidobacteriota bacterium]